MPGPRDPAVAVVRGVVLADLVVQAVVLEDPVVLAVVVGGS